MVNIVSELESNNCIRWLKQSWMVGQVYPWRESEQHLEPMVALLVPLSTAKHECLYRLGYDVSNLDLITNQQFKSLLKKYKIELFTDVNDPRWVNRETTYAREYNRKTLEETQEEVEAMESNKDRLKAISKHLNTSEKRIANGKINGRRGHIHHDDLDHWTLKTEGKSKRHFSGIKRRLAFMDVKTDNDTGGEFAMKRMPTPSEAEYIRSVVGLKQKPEKPVTPQAA